VEFLEVLSNIRLGWMAMFIFVLTHLAVNNRFNRYSWRVIPLLAGFGMTLMGYVMTDLGSDPQFWHRFVGATAIYVVGSSVWTWNLVRKRVRERNEALKDVIMHLDREGSPHGQYVWEKLDE
jgi:hypothetical protein